MRSPVMIGLDFGTSTTKVACRRRDESTSWVVPAARETEGIPWFCTPSEFSFIEGRAVFGRRADTSPGRLKLDLLASGGRRNGLSTQERHAAAFLGWILEHVFGQVRSHYSVDSFRFIVNLGVPVSHFNSTDTHADRVARYERVLRVAVATTSAGGGAGIQDGMGETELNALIDQAIDREPSVKNAAVLPESIAALVSLQQDPMVEAGTYSILDVGAGTTEVSTSILSTSTGGRVVTCYSDSTRNRGAIELQALERDGGDTAPLLDGWWRQWVSSWEFGRRKDAARPQQHRKWKHSTIVLTGGGGFHPSLRSSLSNRLRRSCPARQAFAGEATSIAIEAYVPSGQALAVDTSVTSESRDSFHLLAVAHGLSFHRQEWPDWYSPDQVDDLEPLEMDDGPADPVEAGYSGR